MKIVLIKDPSLRELLQKEVGDLVLVLTSNELEKAIEVYEV